MGRADVYPQPDAPDPVLSAATVLDIASRHTLRATAVLDVDESGGEARAYLLTGNLVVKTQRPTGCVRARHWGRRPLSCDT